MRVAAEPTLPRATVSLSLQDRSREPRRVALAHPPPCPPLEREGIFSCISQRFGLTHRRHLDTSAPKPPHDSSPFKAEVRRGMGAASIHPAHPALQQRR